MTPPLILASASPRRAQLLSMLGLEFDVRPASIDERQQAGEAPAAYAERLSREKSAAVAKALPRSLVIGSDTIVVVDGIVLGKPADADEAVRMLMQLQGREHTVSTGVAVSLSGRTLSAVEHVSVRFRSFDEETARSYAGTGEPLDKAGAYGIQGYGATLVERIEGDYFAVMGLPIVRLMMLIQASGYRYDFGGLIPS